MRDDLCDAKIYSPRCQASQGMVSRRGNWAFTAMRFLSRGLRIGFLGSLIAILVQLSRS